MNTQVLATLPAHGGRMTQYAPAQMALIRKTVAKDTTDDEFNLFMAVAQMKGLDPFSKQISAIVFNKRSKEKRQMAIITTIDGMRAIAARSKRYRPDDEEPIFEYDEALKGPLNPLGLVKASVKLFVADHDNPGAWRKVSGVAYWDEFAPIKDEFAENDAGKWSKTGEQRLDGNWPRMGRLMLAKCAEAQALRKAFPEDLSGLYEGAELDKAALIDVTATEIVEAHAEENRLRAAGVAGAIFFQMAPDQPIEPIMLGQVADRILAALRGWDLATLQWFVSVNRSPLNEFWARAKGDALAVKAQIEARMAQLEAEAKATAEAAAEDQGDGQADAGSQAA